jgi:hypothetical protein
MSTNALYRLARNAGRLRVRAEREQFHNVALGKVVRYKAGLGGELWPARLNDTKVRESPKVNEQLPENRRIHRNTHGLA